MAAITSWIETVGWEGPSVDVGGWLVTGHSNGGEYHILVQAGGAGIFQVKVHGTHSPIDRRKSLGLRQFQAIHR